MTKRAFLIFMGLWGFAGTAISQTVINGEKTTPQVKALFETSPPGEQFKLWIYLDDNAFDSNGVYLTDKARQRRAKVDPEHFLVDRHDYPLDAGVLETIRSSGVSVRCVSRYLKAVSVETDASGLNRLTSLPFVRTVDLVRTFRRTAPDRAAVPKAVAEPSPAALYDYGLSYLQNEFIKAPKMHRTGLTGKGVLIAMLDSGFDIYHPAFDSTSIIATYDFINNDISVDEQDCPTDIYRDQQSFHGTATLSVIGAYVPDTLIGVAPDADFILAKTEITCDDTEIKIEEDNWVAAVEWADFMGADIINSSLGYTTFQDSESYTFDDLDGNTAVTTIAGDIAASKNILVVNSAGNERNTLWGHIVTPADGDSVLAAGAVTSDSSLAAFSSPGPTADGRIKPDIVSLGVGVLTAYHLGGYTYLNGTSFSSPLTAGGAALALQHDSTMTAMELLELIRETGSQATHPDNDFGWGVFDASRAADIIRINVTPVIHLSGSDRAQLDVTTSGRTDSIPSLTTVNLPTWGSFVDFGDGTGELVLAPTTHERVVTSIGLLADIGYFVDTTWVSVEVGEPVYAGPNPFAEAVNIFINPQAGHLLSISIFNSAGEIVWEKVNNSPVTADVIIDRWDGRNQTGEVTAAGVYIVVVNTDRQQFRLKLLKKH